MARQDLIYLMVGDRTDFDVAEYPDANIRTFKYGSVHIVYRDNCIEFTADFAPRAQIELDPAPELHAVCALLRRRARAAPRPRPAHSPRSASERC